MAQEQQSKSRLEERIERGAARGERFVRRDRYALVLVLIILTILSSAFLGDGVAGSVVTLILLSTTLMVTLATSDASPRAQLVGRAVSLLAVVSVIAAEVFHAPGFARLAYFVTLLVMAFATPVVIGRRIAKHPTVNMDTVAGAADIYLLLGLVFAALYTLVGVAQAGLVDVAAGVTGGQMEAAKAFFVANRPTTAGDFFYYSYVTLTTVGFGDLTASSQFVRMLTVTEALTGQLYLVTVVALIVANIGSSRRSIPEPEAGSDTRADVTSERLDSRDDPASSRRA